VTRHAWPFGLTIPFGSDFYDGELVSGFPVFTDEVAFVSDPFDTPQVYTGVTEFVKQRSVRRGRQTENVRPSVGQGTLILGDTERRFDPEYAGVTSGVRDVMVSGNEITDAVRLAGVQGDARPKLDIYDGYAGFHGNFLHSDSTDADFMAQFGVVNSSPAPPLGEQWSYRFTVRPGDVYPPAAVGVGERIEREWGLSGETYGDDFYYSLSMYWPSATWYDAVPGGWLFLWQCFDTNTNGVLVGGPALRLQMPTVDHLQFGWRTGVYPVGDNPTNNFSETFLTPVAKDVWHRFLMKVRFRDDPTGSVQIWHRLDTDAGSYANPASYSLVYDRKNIATMVKRGSYGNPDGISAMSSGLYRAPDPVHTATMYHGPIRRGRAAADVLPGALLPAEKSTGIWPASTNLVPNSSAKTNLAGAAPYGVSTLTRVVDAAAPFGSYYKCVAGSVNNGVKFLSIASGAPLPQGIPYVLRVFVRAGNQQTIGMQVDIQLNEVGGAFATQVVAQRPAWASIHSCVGVLDRDSHARRFTSSGRPYIGGRLLLSAWTCRYWR